MQNDNIDHDMPNRGSPAQHLQQSRYPQQHPIQQPQSQTRSEFNSHDTPLSACIQTFYTKAMRKLALRHGNPTAITPQESQNAIKPAIQKGTAYFKQQQQQQLILQQQ